MKVIIAGGRDFADYNLLCTECDIFLANQEEVEIVSGQANGADKLGEQYAKEKGYPIKIFSPEWRTYGKGAGHITNKKMAEYSNALIAFWDGNSKGTKHMIDTATNTGLIVEVVNY